MPEFDRLFDWEHRGTLNDLRRHQYVQASPYDKTRGTDSVVLFTFPKQRESIYCRSDVGDSFEDCEWELQQMAKRERMGESKKLVGAYRNLSRANAQRLFRFLQMQPNKAIAPDVVEKALDTHPI